MDGLQVLSFRGGRPREWDAGQGKAGGRKLACYRRGINPSALRVEIYGMLWKILEAAGEADWLLGIVGCSWVISDLILSSVSGIVLYWETYW